MDSYDPFCLSISLQLCTSNHNNPHIYIQNPLGMLYLNICLATPLSWKARAADLSKNILNVLVFQFSFLLASQQESLVESRPRLIFHKVSVSYTWLQPPPDHASTKKKKKVLDAFTGSMCLIQKAAYPPHCRKLW